MSIYMSVSEYLIFTYAQLPIFAKGPAVLMTTVAWPVILSREEGSFKSAVITSIV